VGCIILSPGAVDATGTSCEIYTMTSSRWRYVHFEVRTQSVRTAEPSSWERILFGKIPHY